VVYKVSKVLLAETDATAETVTLCIKAIPENKAPRVFQVRLALKVPKALRVKTAQSRALRDVLVKTGLTGETGRMVKTVKTVKTVRW